MPGAVVCHPGFGPLCDFRSRVWQLLGWRQVRLVLVLICLFVRLTSASYYSLFY